VLRLHSGPVALWRTYGQDPQGVPWVHLQERALQPLEARLLARLVAGQTLAAVLASLCRQPQQRNVLTAELGEWLQGWAAVNLAAPMA
jgi:hypothetical protein